MHINYHNKSVQEVCTDARKAKKKYGAPVADKLLSTITFIEAAETLLDVRDFPVYHFHALKGELKKLYAIDLGRKLGWRLIVRPMMGDRPATNEEIFGREVVKIQIIEVKEVSNHYA